MWDLYFGIELQIFFYYFFEVVVFILLTGKRQLEVYT